MGNEIDEERIYIMLVPSKNMAHRIRVLIIT